MVSTERIAAFIRLQIKVPIFKMVETNLKISIKTADTGRANLTAVEATASFYVNEFTS